MRGALALLVVGGAIAAALSLRDPSPAVENYDRAPREAPLRSRTAVVVTSTFLSLSACASAAVTTSALTATGSPPVHELPSRREGAGKEKLCRVHGSVRDRRGQPCSHATVEVFNEFLAALAGHAELTFEADDQGEFIVVLPLLDPHVIRARAPGLVTLRPASFGFRPCSRTRIYDADVVDDRTVEAIVLAPPAELRGTLLDDGGRPIRTGYVSVYGSVHCQEFFAMPDASGRFVLKEAPEDLYTVYGKADGYRASSCGERVAVVEGAGGDVAVVMTRSSSADLRGRVVAPEPVGSGRAYIGEHGSRRWFRWQDIESGAFVFKEREPGDYDIFVRTPGWTGRTTVKVAAGDAIEEVVVTLARAPRIRRRLLDTSGRPLGGRTVFIQGPETVDAERSTNAEGVVEFTDIAAGTYDVNLGSEFQDHFTISRGLAVAGDVALDVVVEFATVRGRLVAPEKARFSWGHYSTAATPRGALSDLTFVPADDGSFEIVDLPPTSVWLSVDGKCGEDELKAVQRFALHPGVNQIQLEVPRCGSARVRVVGPGSHPVDRFTKVDLWLERLDVPETQSVETRADDGVFVLTGLAPGRYRVSLEERSLALLKRLHGAQEIKGPPIEFAVSTGERVERDLVFSVER